MSEPFEAGVEIWVKATVRSHVAGGVYDIEVGEGKEWATVHSTEITER